MFAAVGGVDTAIYKVFFLLHILAVIVGFGSSFVWPVLGAQARNLGPGPASLAISQTALKYSKVLTTAAIYLAALFGILALNTSIDTYATSVQAGHRQAASASALHSAFKTQVQEWKNTLLRGKDPKALDRHWGAFGRVEKDIERTTGQLVASLPPGEARMLLERFSQAHHKMGEQYRGAYAEFRAAGFDAMAGDKAVQGLDREPARLIEEASAKLTAQSEALSAASGVSSRCT